MGRIVLFGATGYTGRLVAGALVERGQRPVLAGRSADRLNRLAEELGGLETQVADVARPATVAALVDDPADVLVSTVGPFTRFGDPAVAAAVRAGCSYVDSTGEPAFIRRVFERFGPRARESGAGLLPALGYDFVPGNLACALALEEAGADARAVEAGYFGLGSAGSMSGGTLASLVDATIEPGFAWRGGRLVDEIPARRVRSFSVGGRELDAVSVGGSEHLALPRLHPQLEEVGVYLGWFGSRSRLVSATAPLSALLYLPGARPLARAVSSRLVRGSSGGPADEDRERSRSQIVAIARDAHGRALAEVFLEGVNGYTFTGRMIAWAAGRLAAGEDEGLAGALGPVEAFGLAELEAGSREAGIASA